MRTTALTAGGAALVLALSACGTDQDSPQVFNSIENLVEASQESTEQLETMQLWAEMTVNDTTIKGFGEGKFTGDDSALFMGMRSREVDTEARILGTTMYLKLPEEQRPEGKLWVEISLDGADEISHLVGDDLEMSGQMAQDMDLDNTLEELKTTGTITDSEETELYEKPVTHYWIEQDTEKVLEQRADALELSDEELDELREQLPETRPVELWLNEDQIPRKITMDMDDSETSEDEPVDISGPMTMEYSDWGTEVNVEEPPADLIVDAEEIAPN